MANAPHETSLLITCEHASNHIPAIYAPLFLDAHSALASHRGFDIGAARIARHLAKVCNGSLILARNSRLLVDLNRSIGHPKLFSEMTKKLSGNEKDRLLEKYYHPHRQAVWHFIDTEIAARRRILHVASHSFTPVFNGIVRDADVGLLFDPQRPGESAACRSWQAALARCGPHLRVRRNAPYRGTADGLTTTLRRKFDAASYIGIELEVNQQLMEGRCSAGVQQLLATTLRDVIQACRFG